MNAKMIGLVAVTFAIVSCNDSITILKNRNFDDGDWLLVNENFVEKTLLLIGDKNTLKESPDGIKIDVTKEDKFTTCDGSIKLYKNGKLVAGQAYLSSSHLTESVAIREAYKKGQNLIIYPKNNADFRILWDSLKKEPRNYPTRYHTQPEDKDVIWNYKYE